MSHEGHDRSLGRPRTFYQLLGLSSEASEEEVRVAFRTLAKRLHPEAEGGGDPKRFKDISEAYATLKNPQTRQQYDKSLGIVKGAFTFSNLNYNPNESFADFFNKAIDEVSGQSHKKKK